MLIFQNQIKVKVFVEVVMVIEEVVEVMVRGA